MGKRKTLPQIKAEAKAGKPISFAAEVTIKAGETANGPKRFDVVAYTGGALNVRGYDLPVVVDLAGMSFSKSLVANLDHQSSQRVGHVTDKSKADGQLALGGFASAATAARDEVVKSSADGFVWQASIEAQPNKLLEMPAGKQFTANGQTFDGPMYLAKKSTLQGFAFVSHGADDNTTVTIAAGAAATKEKKMKPEVQAWAESMGIDCDNLTADQQATIEANYAGQNRKPDRKKTTLKTGIEAQTAEAERIEAITEYALNASEKRQYDYNAREVIASINELAEQAIEAKWTLDKFRLELMEAGFPQAHTVSRGRREDRMTDAVIECAIAKTGRLGNVEKRFSEQTLEAADKHFKNGITLKQALVIAAEGNGYRGSHGGQITLDLQRAAFGMTGPRQQIQAGGFSTVNIANVISNVANKFLREGWDAVDMTPMRIAAIRPVNDFKTITTVSLTGDLQFEKIGAAGEIPHGQLADMTYSNKADTYARMLAITRQDMINDDLGALTSVPKRMGRGGALKLNDIFWTAFLDNGSFFASGNVNVNTGVADMTIGGIAATEAIFLNQTDPDSKPLAATPKILLVPTALKYLADAIVDPSSVLVTGATSAMPNANVFRGRFRVESSPYMANSSYTGYSAVAWYMLADPGEIPVIEIVALNGRVEPVVETADADFNVLGIQMRGYSDVGVTKQEYRGGVRADGGSS